MVDIANRGGQQDAPLESKTKYTNEDLKIMQGWSLERKIRVTQTRIIEWYEHFEGQVYVSFSGGKDSTVLLDLVRRIYPDVPAVYVDTGLEYPEIKEFVKRFDNVTIVRPSMSFKEVVLQYGYPVISKRVSRSISDVKKLGDNCWSARCFDGRETGLYNMQKWKFMLDAPFKVSNKCCDVMKKKPFKQYEKETKRKPFVGTMASESTSRKNNWKRFGCNAFESGAMKSQPMSFWTEQDVLEYISRFDIPYASVYGEILRDDKGKYRMSKCDRTGCVFCMYGCHLQKEPNRFQLLKESHPKIYAWCMRPIEDGGLGLAAVLDFIGVKYE